ncbi:MAG: hypothetical protein Q7R75_02415 [bacterium]|nr:hypothetical protein [bacterium]
MKIYHNSTLNPVFTEKEVFITRENISATHEVINEILAKVNKLETEEVLKLNERKVDNFKPSEEIIGMLKEACLWRLFEENLLRDLFSMIETNIKVLSEGENIEKAYLDYKSKYVENSIPLPSNYIAAGDKRVDDKFNILRNEKLNQRWFSMSRTSSIWDNGSFWTNENLWNNLPVGLVGTREDYEDEKNQG